MEREIIFRAKSVFTNEWVKGYLREVWAPKDCERRFLISPGMRFEEDGVTDTGEVLIKPETIGMYIGFEDFEGTRIFEGDILITSTGQKHIVLYSRPNRTWGVVNQYDYNAYAHIERNGTPFYEYCANPPSGRDWFVFVEARVIGNIYDNPELINKSYE